jgi:hypothetical protein
MLNRLLRRRSPSAEDPGLPEVSQPAPSDAPTPRRVPPPEASAGLFVQELSEMEARALCAREGIPVFWPRPATLPHDDKTKV